MMKKLTELKLGQKVVAQIIEVVSRDILLIDHEGTLVRVANETNHQFAQGDRIELIVSSLQPMRLRLASQQRRRRRKISGLDVQI